MSGTSDQQIPSEDGTDRDDVIAGDGSGDPNDDRAFLNDLPPAQDKRLEDSGVDATDPDPDDTDALATGE